MAGCTEGSAAALGLRKQVAGTDAEVAANAARIAPRIEAWHEQHAFAAVVAAELQLSSSAGAEGDAFPAPSVVAAALAMCDPNPGVAGELVLFNR